MDSDDSPSSAGATSAAPLLPGRGWRALVIGAALEDVVRDLGEPSHTEPFDTFIAVDWRPLGIRAYLDLEQRVMTVSAVFREIYVEGFAQFPGATDRGIGADSSIEDIEAAYGPAPERRGNKGESLVYEDFLFSFHRGQLHEISINPANQPVQHKPLPEPLPNNELGARALELVAELERRVAALGREDIEVVITPARLEWVENVERRQGHRLSPSYRQLVLERGTVHVEVEGRNTAWMISVEDLGGPEPTSWVDEGDEEVDEAVSRCLYFAYQLNDSVDDYYTFDPANVDERGEMAVGCYYHDERFEGGGGMGFADYLERAIEQLFESYLA